MKITVDDFISKYFNRIKLNTMQNIYSSSASSSPPPDSAFSCIFNLSASIKLSKNNRDIPLLRILLRVILKSNTIYTNTKQVLPVRRFGSAHVVKSVVEVFKFQFTR